MTLCLLLASNAFALNIPEKPAGYVNDYATLLTDATRQKLEGLLGQFEKETSNQVVVAIFPSLEGEVLEDFSIRLAEQWKIGTKEHDNGVLLLIFKNDRKVRLEVGYGLEGALPDATARMIIQHEIMPLFRSGDFNGGVLNAANAIIRATKGEYKAPSSVTDDPMKKHAPSIFMAMIFYLLFPLLLYVLIIGFLSSTMGLPGFALGLGIVLLLFWLRKLFLSPLGGTFSRGGYWAPGGFGGGFSSGGGFSGGGGGSFGGGGASGGW